ncbi:MAG: AlpA family phage regulatory protein [Burkholderiaceae bacterium]|nr:AlpA family phage regulatory protein [Burkholderiaceae bacterium]
MATSVIERRAVPRTAALRLLRLREVIHICGLSRSGIYAAIKEDRFPRSVPIGERARAWVQHEIENWAGQRMRARN